MSELSRGVKMVKMCTATKEESDPNSFWLSKKTSNWFCNRGLSPPSIINSPHMKKTEIGDEHLKWEENKVDSNKKILIHQVLTIRAPYSFPFSTSEENDSNMKENLTGEKDLLDFKEKHNRDAKSSELSIYKNEHDLNLSSPEDLLHVSNDSGSSYVPCEEDEDTSCCSSKQISICIKRNAKLGSKNKAKRKKDETLSLQQCALKKFKNGTDENVVSTTMSVSENKKYITSSNTQDDTRASCSKVPYKRKRDHCYFCETNVHNFSRHIKRNHPMETEVSEILSKPIKSKARRNLLDRLRRKGNFLASGGGCFKVVRQTYLPDRDVLPCDNCLGFFSSKLLFRHRKKCLGDICKGSAQAAGQLKLVINSRVDRRLKEEVFPRMRADKISLEAKNDTLICAFGARYLHTHREKHFIHVTSRKMRELSKMLIEVKKLDPSITNLFSALRPKYFDLLVDAAKRVARYDPEMDVFMSPTFAMNISTSLKQCCNIAITYNYKRQLPYLSVSSGEAEAELKTLIHLFESNWSFEISAQAANNLNLNKWNKVTIIPLASDLKLLRRYLINLAEDASKKLKEGNNIEAYDNLIESLYCRTILLNRKRSGELQRMLLHTYISTATEKQQYEEFHKVISSAEQIILRSLKRVVIRGKRSKGVPVLFSSDTQNHMKVLLEVREYYVPKENPYLFAKSNSLSHIIGYKILTKHAKRCGAKNPLSITSTRLRKHLATLSQLFNLSDNEIEQLAIFMGHTPGVHRGSYRLPDEIYQTAKISKLLLLMEKGGASEYKGKSLDEINIDLEEDLLDGNEGNDESDLDDESTLNLDDIVAPSTQPSVATATIPKRSRTVVPWTTKQKEVTKMYFKQHIKTKKPPKKSECEELKFRHPELLRNKDWLKIKVFIQNEYSKKK